MLIGQDAGLYRSIALLRVVSCSMLGTPPQTSRSPAVVQRNDHTVRLLWCAGVNVARMLVDQGDLVLIADNQGVRDIYSADGNSIDKSTPLVVLVNKGTASASEVSSQAPVRWGLETHVQVTQRLLIISTWSACQLAALCSACAAPTQPAKHWCPAGWLHSLLSAWIHALVVFSSAFQA
jgi:hypothetical protein